MIALVATIDVSSDDSLGLRLQRLLGQSGRCLVDLVLDRLLNRIDGFLLVRVPRRTHERLRSLLIGSKLEAVERSRGGTNDYLSRRDLLVSSGSGVGLVRLLACLLARGTSFHTWAANKPHLILPLAVSLRLSSFF